MGEFKIVAQVVGLAPDTDQFTGEHYTQVHLAIEREMPQNMPHTPFSGVKPTYWKYILNIFIPASQWREQYKMWHKYELIVKDNGELSLKQTEES